MTIPFSITEHLRLGALWDVGSLDQPGRLGDHPFALEAVGVWSWPMWWRVSPLDDNIVHVEVRTPEGAGISGIADLRHSVPGVVLGSVGFVDQGWGGEAVHRTLLLSYDPV